MNAAGALRVKMGLSFTEGVELAKESIESGQAFQKLKQFLKLSSNNAAKLESLEAKL